MTLQEKLYLFENQSMSYYIYTFIFVQEKYNRNYVHWLNTLQFQWH